MSMATLGKLAAMAVGHVDESSVVIKGVGTDTRASLVGDLFVAIRGPRFDGHDHLKAAAASGAGHPVSRHSGET